MALSFHVLLPWKDEIVDHNFTLIYNTAKNIYTVTYQGTASEPKQETFDIWFKDEKAATEFAQRVAAEREQATALQKTFIITVPDRVIPPVVEPAK